MPTIPDGSTTLLCPKLFWMTSDLIFMEVLIVFSFSTAMLLAVSFICWIMLHELTNFQIGDQEKK